MSLVSRCFVKKKKGFDVGAQTLLEDLKSYLGIDGLTDVSIFIRYDVQGVPPEIYKKALGTVFSEPQSDELYMELPHTAGRVLTVEALPGQYDQRADSCAGCVQMLYGGERPLVMAATVYVLHGGISDEQFEKIRGYIINPVESREASPDLPETLEVKYPEPLPVNIISGFTAMDNAEAAAVHSEYSLAMDMDDLRFLQNYFKNEGRDPTVTELKLLDAYWSDHCRHTTFLTRLEDIEIEDERVKAAYEEYLGARAEVYGEKADSRPVSLMDIATAGMKTLRKRGALDRLEVSEEVNACSAHVDVNVDGKTEDWLMMFKNETHNHPTEIEPFGGASTCLGGAIRDPMSGRAYVYQAMRITGAGDPRTPFGETLPGKLPQRKITTTAASGYSSYGNQIGISSGFLHEIYHPGYVAKRMELGALVGAIPAADVVRLEPAPGDVVILLGGRTGRDGIGGATGSSKTQTEQSTVTASAEVQKGSAPEERKIVRLFRDPEVTRMIKRCNDFGAGGVSVAIGELAPGLLVELDTIPAKYDGLNGTELALSESQERMAVVVAPENIERFKELALSENLEATVVARVTEEPRLRMMWRGKEIVNISREFLNTSGTEKRAGIHVPKLPKYAAGDMQGPPVKRLREMAGSLQYCSQRGLAERFDSSVGASTVLVPLGGAYQNTTPQVMAALFPVTAGKKTDTCSVMSFAFDPFRSELNPFDAAADAVTESLAKLIAAGCSLKDCYLTFQEYYERLGDDKTRWGKPFSALLGALSAQLGYGVASVGGKDSMSGSFMDIHVPPALVSFAVAPACARDIISPELKAGGNPVYLFEAADAHDFGAVKDAWEQYGKARAEGSVLSAWAVTDGGIAEGIMKMSFGNGVGFKLADGFDAAALFTTRSGAIIAECAREIPGAILIGHTSGDGRITFKDGSVGIDELLSISEGVLEGIFPVNAAAAGDAPRISYTEGPVIKAPALITGAPRVLLPVLPDTSCEYDTAEAVRAAGGTPEKLIIRNLTPGLLSQSVEAMETAIRQSQMIIIPGGFSGADEQDGSGEFISAFFRHPRITDAVHELLGKRGGLMLGISSGFRALVKLGLLPYGEIRDMSGSCPAVTFNVIGRHQSRYVHTRVASNKSPWLTKCLADEVYTVPVSHGAGRFAADTKALGALTENGQIAAQYCDPAGNPSMDIQYNPNGSIYAVEALISPDGRVLGKMGHIERRGDYVAKNIPGNKHMPIFEGGVAYFK